MYEVTDKPETSFSSFTRITAKRKNGDAVFIYSDGGVTQCKHVRSLLFKLARRFKELTMLDIANLAHEGRFIPLVNQYQLRSIQHSIEIQPRVIITISS